MMYKKHRPLWVVSGLALLLAGCAGTPPAGSTKVASKKKCERTIGSLMCSSDDDQPLGSTNDPSLLQHGIGTGGGTR